jgi:hypothetical protein
VPKTEPEEDNNGAAYSYHDIDEIKYFEQFTKPAPTPYPEVSEPEIKTNWFILILIIGIITLIIIMVLILISRLKY